MLAGKRKPRLFKNTRCDIPLCLLRAWRRGVLDSGLLASLPMLRRSEDPGRSEVLAATQQRGGLDSSRSGPGRGLSLAPPRRGPAPPSTCDLVSSVPAGATGGAAGALSLEGATKGLLIGKTFPTPGIGVQRRLFKTSGWGCVIIYPRLRTYHLPLLDQQMFTRFPPQANKCGFWFVY